MFKFSNFHIFVPGTVRQLRRESSLSSSLLYSYTLTSAQKRTQRVVSNAIYMIHAAGTDTQHTHTHTHSHTQPTPQKYRVSTLENKQKRARRRKCENKKSQKKTKKPQKCLSFKVYSCTVNLCYFFKMFKF